MMIHYTICLSCRSFNDSLLIPTVRSYFFPLFLVLSRSKNIFSKPNRHLKTVLSVISFVNYKTCFSVSNWNQNSIFFKIFNCKLLSLGFYTNLIQCNSLTPSWLQVVLNPRSCSSRRCSLNPDFLDVASSRWISPRWAPINELRHINWPCCRYEFN